MEWYMGEGLDGSEVTCSENIDKIKYIFTFGRPHLLKASHTPRNATNFPKTAKVGHFMSILASKTNQKHYLKNERQ
jgi:hypothetical protein